jgi:hypothetical protein
MGWVEWPNGPTAPVATDPRAEERADLEWRTAVLLEGLPPKMEQLDRAGRELRAFYDRAWRIARDDLGRMDALDGWRREWVGDEIGTNVLEVVEARVKAFEHGIDRAALLARQDPLGEKRAMVERLAREVEEFNARELSGTLLPVPPRHVPGGPGVPTLDEVRALFPWIRAELGRLRRHVETPDAAPPDERENVYVNPSLYGRRDARDLDVLWYRLHVRRTALRETLALDARFLEARWALVDLHAAAARLDPSEKVLALAREERRELLAEQEKAIGHIRARALPFAEQRIAALRELARKAR